MNKYKVVRKTDAWVIVDAESENEALEIAAGLQDHEFDGGEWYDYIAVDSGDAAKKEA